MNTVNLYKLQNVSSSELERKGEESKAMRATRGATGGNREVGAGWDRPDWIGLDWIGRDSIEISPVI